MPDNQNKENFRIILSGGGSGGPVAPLIGMAEALKRAYPEKKFGFLWLGTKTGPEKAMLSQTGIVFIPISSGKWRRYFSLKNLSDIVLIIRGFFESLAILRAEKPDLLMSAGGFVSVPAAFAAWILRIPVLIHQQDVRPGLANRLMAPLAKAITVTFASSLHDYGPKAVWAGNPVRKEFRENRIDRRTALQKLGLSGNRPTVLVMGGGTGSLFINRLVFENLKKLTDFCQVIHISGKNSGYDFDNLSAQNGSYRHFEFLNTEGMIKAFTVADAVVSRCGMSTLTELSHLGKACILIPMPGSHQEDNARVFREQKAALILEEKNLDGSAFVREVKKLISDEELKSELGGNIRKVIRTDETYLSKIIMDSII